MIIEFMLNRRRIRADVNGDIKLVHFLRDELGLPGTKSGCEIGECGACSVIMDGKLIKSCLVPVKKAAGKDITTIEGLSLPDGTPGDIQQAFLDHGATQCGYCTPGMILAAESLLLNNPHPSRDDIRVAISENLCRCTGYQQIIDAIESAAKQRETAGRLVVGTKND